jgi:hypothetical protein
MQYKVFLKRILSSPSHLIVHHSSNVSATHSLNYWQRRNISTVDMLHDDHLGTKYMASFGQGMPLLRETRAEKLYWEINRHKIIWECRNVTDCTLLNFPCDKGSFIFSPGIILWHRSFRCSNHGSIIAIPRIDAQETSQSPVQFLTL